MERRWSCGSCGWTTNCPTAGGCKDCGCDIFLIPLRLDFSLFLAILSTVEHAYSLEVLLNNSETAVELFDIYTGHKVVAIRNWDDFRLFFGEYFYRCFNCEESE